MPNFCLLRPQILVICLLSNFTELCKVGARLDKINIGHFKRVPPGMFKKQGTPLLLFLSDNIDGTQTFLTQLSAVKPTSSEKRGKIQTNKMFCFFFRSMQSEEADSLARG